MNASFKPKAARTAPRLPNPKGLRRELGLVLVAKLMALVALWLAFFHRDPNLPRPERADLFSPPSTQSLPKE